MTNAIIDPASFVQQDWQGDALCAQTDPGLFFPKDKEGVAQAKKVCQSCNAVEQCLRWAITTKQIYGIWGGATLRERNKLAKGKPLVTNRKVPQLTRNQRIVELHDMGISVRTLAQQNQVEEFMVQRIIDHARSRAMKLSPAAKAS